MKPKAPKRIWLQFGEGVIMFDRFKTRESVEYILRADAKRKPLPLRLSKDADATIAYLEGTYNQDLADIVRELLKRAGGR